MHASSPVDPIFELARDCFGEKRVGVDTSAEGCRSLPDLHIGGARKAHAVQLHQRRG